MTIIVQSIASASARDYDWLKASIAGWLHRDDLEEKIPDFVMLAEKRINGDLEARLSEGLTTLTTIPGEASVKLPADFAQMRSLSLLGYDPLDYVTPAQFDKPESGGAALPHSYTITGSLLRLKPTPSAEYTLTMVYRGGVPALADSGDTNWLIEQNADAYLAASMCEALMYTGDDAKLQKWEAKYANAIRMLNNTDEWDDASSLAIGAPTR
jgi:hypothetical protein